jgi:hypothetical protein
MKKYIFLVLGIIIGLSSINSFNSWLHRADKVRGMDAAKSLVAHPQAVTAMLDDQYEGSVFKMHGVALDTTFEIGYTYVVNGSTYTGKYTTDKMPTSMTQTVYYDATRPSYSAMDPKANLKALQDKASSNFDLYFAIFIFLVGVGMVMKYKELRKAEKDEEAAQDERLRKEREAFMAQ